MALNQVMKTMEDGGAREADEVVPNNPSYVLTLVSNFTGWYSFC
jgi:hypothetical protein